MRCLPLLLLATCSLPLPSGRPASAGAPFDCDAIALRDGLGDPDPCDVQACAACVEACGASCAVLESYPPQYSCDGESSWDVYDTCPDWTFPEA